MTLREIIDLIIRGKPLTDDIAGQCFLAASDMLHTIVRWALMAMKNQGSYEVTAQGLQKFMDECPEIMTIEIPVDIIRLWEESLSRLE